MDLEPMMQEIDTLAWGAKVNGVELTHRLRQNSNAQFMTLTSFYLYFAFRT